MLELVHPVLADMNTQGIVYAGLGRIDAVTVSQNELAAFRDLLEADESADEHGVLERPYPVPDNLTSAVRYIEDLYSNESLRSLVEQVYNNALAIYSDLVDTYFASLKPTLGLACILPVAMQGKLLIRDDQSFGSTLDYTMEPIALAEFSRVEVRSTDRRAESGQKYEDLRAEGHRIHQLIDRLHPSSAGWAHPRRVRTAISVFKDRPATCQAYQWLWEDLEAVHLVESSPPHGES